LEAVSQRRLLRPSGLEIDPIALCLCNSTL
jgi:hypothetical protein